MKINVILSVLLLSICLCSCKKLGCTDQNAMNFEKEAKKNDQSCAYEGSVGIWFDTVKAQEYAVDSVITLIYFVDGNNVGTISSGQYSNVLPTCDSPEVLTVEFNMGKVSSAAHSLIVKRETGLVIDNYIFTVEGGKCSLYLLK